MTDIENIKTHMINQSYKYYPDYGSQHPKQQEQEEKRKFFMDAVNETLKIVNNVMYSEKDMNDYTEYCTDVALTNPIGFPWLSPKEWSKQFKNK